MPHETGRPSQLKQRRRKGKKAWRKNIDLNDIDEQLEQKLEDEIYLGTTEPEFSEDRAGSDAQLSKAMRAEKRLKSQEILYGRSAVPALVSQHKKKDKPKSKVMKDRKKLLERAGFTDKDRFQAELERDGLVKAAAAADLWSAPAAPAAKAPRAPRRVERAPQAPVPGTPAVGLPQGGQSYNPSLDDWKATILREHAKLVKDEERELKAAEDRARIEAIIFETEARMSAADGDSDGSDGSDSSAEDAADATAVRLSVNPPASQVRKTRVQRNKEKRHKRFLREIAELKEKKKFLLALQAAKADEAAAAAPAETGAAPKAKTLLRAHSRHPMVAEPLAVKLSDELDDSLRRLRPEGSLLHERVRSLQARGIIEARVPLKRPRRRTKVVEKWSYKHFA